MLILGGFNAARASEGDVAAAALPRVNVRISQPGSAVHRPIAVMPTDGSPVQLALLALPASPFHPTQYSWAQVQPVINS